MWWVVVSTREQRATGKEKSRVWVSLLLFFCPPQSSLAATGARQAGEGVVGLASTGTTDLTGLDVPPSKLVSVLRFEISLDLLGNGGSQETVCAV